MYVVKPVVEHFSLIVTVCFSFLFFVVIVSHEDLFNFFEFYDLLMVPLGF
jgi:hypothetical protein